MADLERLAKIRLRAAGLQIFAMHPSRSPILRVIFVSLAVVSFTTSFRAADRPAATEETESITRALEGVWVYVGEPGNVGPAPRSGGRFKFRMSNRWTFTEADPSTGVVKAHFGGTYRVRGNEYIETIDYSSDPDDPELRSTLKFSVKIEGDLMTQTGVGNPYTEVWKRVR